MDRRVAAAVVALGTLRAQGLWEPRAPFPVAATEVSSAALSGKIYSVCGLTASGSLSALFIYDSKYDAWRPGAPVPIQGGADHCNVAAANGRLYVLGAIRIGSSFVDGNTYEYDPALDRWQTVARMNTPRGASGVAAIGTKIYVAGGLDAARSVGTFEVFDAVTKQWSALPPMPTARDHLTAQAVNGKIYAISGRSGNTLAANEEFDPQNNAWRTRAPIPTPRGGLASGTLMNRIQAFGGEGPSGTPQGTYAQNEEYDPATDTWRPLAPMPLPRHGFYGATYDGRIFAPGGGPQAGAHFSTANDAFYLPPATVALAAVRNAASLAAAISLGSIATIFGSNLSFGEQIATAVPLPSRLNAVSVNVNGESAPVFYVSPGQINFYLPGIPAGGTVAITVNNAGAESAPLAIGVSAAAPALFSLDGSGAGPGAVLIAGTGIIASAEHPARKGEIVELYGTGMSTAAPEIRVGGVPAEVLYAGPAPGYIGLSQVNARIPAGAQTGAAVPVIATLGGQGSNAVTIAVSE